MQFQWLALAACLVVAPLVSAQDWSPDEKAVWQLEEEYWRYVSTGDIDAYVKLWHEDFVGWPCFEWKPARKGDIGKWVRDIRDNKWKLTYQLKPLEMQEFGGNTVVVHYAAEYVYDYGDGTKSGVDLLAQVHTHLDEIRRQLADHRRHVRRPGAGQGASRIGPRHRRLWPCDVREPAIGQDLARG